MKYASSATIVGLIGFLCLALRYNISIIELNGASQGLTTTYTRKSGHRFQVLQDIGFSTPLAIFNNNGISARGTWSASSTQLNMSCPIILSGHHQVAGLGHAFMSFNTLVALASFYNMTLNASFPERLSHGRYQEQVSKFFGGDLFHARFNDETCRVRMEVDASALATTMATARKSCQDGPVCVQLKGAPAQVEALVDVDGYRRNFAIPEETRKELQTMPWIDNDRFLRVVIHIRRGDVVDRPRRTNRWVYNTAYLDFIPKLIRRLQTSLPIVVILLVEGAESVEAVPDVVGNRTANFSSLHHSVMLGPSETHLALATMCMADILVTSSSSFSHVGALLCEQPHVLVVPFWYSYVHIRNTLTELVPRRDDQGAIVSLDLPATFHFNRRRNRI